MTTDGIEAVYLETHNWGRSARFFQALGYQIDFETGHSCPGLLRNGSGPYLFIAEVPDGAPTGMQLVLRSSTLNEALDPVVEVVTPLTETHHGAREMTVRDPDGRTWVLQAATPPGQ